MKFTAGIDLNKCTLFRLIKRRFEYPVNKHAPTSHYDRVAMFLLRQLAKLKECVFNSYRNENLKKWRKKCVKNSKYFSILSVYIAFI